MIKRVCNVVKIGDNYLIQPRMNSNLNNLCLTSCTNHVGHNFDSNFIFDFRTEILNRKLKNNLQFYLLLIDENSQEINLSNNLRGESFIYIFNRKKEKINRETVLKYYPKVEKFNINTSNNHIYLGNAAKIDMKQVAYETTSCFSDFYSPNGGGYYGFCINFENLVAEPRYAVLFVDDINLSKPINTNIFSNNRINHLVNRNSDYNTETYMIEPSAPYLPGIPEPSAPIYEEPH